MEFTTLTFQGVDYKCRVIEDLSGDSERLIVGPEELGRLLMAGVHYTSHEAEHLDSGIAYYANDEEMELDDNELYFQIYGEE